MARIKLKQVDGISRKPLKDAYGSFMRHCQLKNLSPYSYLYYEKNLQFFFELIPNIKYVDEITKGIIEEFVGQLMDRGNRVTAINARLRAVHVFLSCCSSVTSASSPTAKNWERDIPKALHNACKVGMV